MLDSLIVSLMLAASGTDLSNERFQVSGADLEKHWQVDCKAVVQRYRQIADSAPSSVETMALQGLQADAGKCAIIYNTKNTGRTLDCPDYEQIRMFLSRLQQGVPDPARPAALNCESPAP